MIPLLINRENKHQELRAHIHIIQNQSMIGFGHIWHQWESNPEGPYVEGDIQFFFKVIIRNLSELLVSQSKYLGLEQTKFTFKY